MPALVSVAATSPSAVSSTPLKLGALAARRRVVLYNTIYCQRALDPVAASGHQLDDVHRAPQLARHRPIILTGRYRIALLEALRDRGSYREPNTTHHRA